MEYDLSNVLFIATANVLHTIPGPLQDRMEIIRLSGYTELEKLEIAKRFLVTKQLEGNGLKTEQLQFEESGLRTIINGYTRESGVRNLEREIGNVCRKVARQIVMAMPDENAEPVAANAEMPAETEAKPKKTRGKKKAAVEAVPTPEGFQKAVVSETTVSDFLGPIKFRDTTTERKNEIGATTGLAWTEVGGSILTTEVSVIEGRGKLTTTGKLGEVMQESAQAAMTYVRSRAHELGLPRDFYRHIDIHVHVPEGAIPKDGPSAGITLATSISSALAKIPVRGDIAMTGEITLRGKVLPIGGVKEKLMAAHRQGIFEAVLPKENEKDMVDVPEIIRGAMKLHFVEHMDEVLKIALERQPEALPPQAIDFAAKTVEDLRH